MLNNKFVDLGEPKRGDVVVFRFPGYLCEDGGRLVRSGDISCSDPHAPVPQQNWIKRVIGLPGDSIEVHGADAARQRQAGEADETGPYVGNPQRSVDQIMLNMGATVWTEHLRREDGKVIDHTIARMPAYYDPYLDSERSRARRRCPRVANGDGRQPQRQPRQPLVGLHAGAEPGRQGVPDLDELEGLGYRMGGLFAHRYGDPRDCTAPAAGRSADRFEPAAHVTRQQCENPQA